MSQNPVYTIGDYFKARIPDFDKFLPGFNVSVAEASAMAFYWRLLMPADVEPYTLDQSRLGELQKTLVALRMVVSAIPVMMANVSSNSAIVKAQSGPEMFQFEERVKYYNLMAKNWQTELEQMESALGISNMAARVPSYRKVVPGVCNGLT